MHDCHVDSSREAALPHRKPRPLGGVSEVPSEGIRAGREIETHSNSSSARKSSLSFSCSHPARFHFRMSSATESDRFSASAA